MPKQKEKRSAPQCIDDCGSTNPRTIARHKRMWRSSVSAGLTKYATAPVPHASSQTHWTLPGVGPSGSVATEKSRATGQCAFSSMLQAHSQRLGATFNNESEQANFDFFSNSENLGSGSLSAYDCDSEGGGRVGMVLIVRMVTVRREGLTSQE